MLQLPLPALWASQWSTTASPQVRLPVLLCKAWPTLLQRCHAAGEGPCMSRGQRPDGPD